MKYLYNFRLTLLLLHTRAIQKVTYVLE